MYAAPPRTDENHHWVWSNTCASIQARRPKSETNVHMSGRQLLYRLQLLLHAIIKASAACIGRSCVSLAFQCDKKMQTIQLSIYFSFYRNWMLAQHSLADASKRNQRNQPCGQLLCLSFEKYWSESVLSCDGKLRMTEEGPKVDFHISGPKLGNLICWLAKAATTALIFWWFPSMYINTKITWYSAVQCIQSKACARSKTCPPLRCSGRT